MQPQTNKQQYIENEAGELTVFLVKIVTALEEILISHLTCGTCLTGETLLCTALGW
jgi:hypothetical protein